MPRASRPHISARRCRSAAWTSGALLRHLHHVIDGLLDQIVRRVGAPALGGHHPGTAREALDRVFVQGVLALSDPRCPGSFIPGTRCAADSLTVAGTAGLLEELGAVR